MDWRRTILVAGKRTTPEEWLAEVWERITDRQFAEAFRRAGFRHVNRNMVREKRRSLGLSKAVSRNDRLDPEDISKLVVEIDDPGPAVVMTGAVPAGPASPNGLDATEVLRSIRNRPKTLRELSSEFDRSEDTIGGVIEALKGQHFNIVQIDGRHSLDTKSVQAPDASLPRTLADEAGMRLALGIISDLHAGSTAQQITSLSQFVHHAADEGVHHFLVPGDLVAGTDVYRGQLHDLYAIGADKQLAALLETLPEIPPVAYYVIGGNHDHSFVKATGYNIVAALAAQRDDVHYFGFDMGDVPLTDRVDARLWHPSGGVPYAVSYRLQKGMEQMAYDELTSAIQRADNPKMRVVVSGHLHVAMTMWRGPIIGLQAGCWEGQTNYLKRKGLYPQVGGYIVELWLTDSGLIQRCRHEFHPYLEIENDYRNYPEMLERIGVTPGEGEARPLFAWEPGEEGEDDSDYDHKPNGLRSKEN